MQNNFYFIGNFSNIYKNPSKRSEVTSQIMYGEKFKILAKNKEWIKIKTLFDNYKDDSSSWYGGSNPMQRAKQSNTK